MELKFGWLPILYVIGYVFVVHEGSIAAGVIGTHFFPHYPDKLRATSPLALGARRGNSIDSLRSVFLLKFFKFFGLQARHFAPTLHGPLVKWGEVVRRDELSKCVRSLTSPSRLIFC
jgi:hypothetical protein